MQVIFWYNKIYSDNQNCFISLHDEIWSHGWMQNWDWLSIASWLSQTGQTKVPLCSTGLHLLWGRCLASFHTNLQSRKAGQQVLLTTYSPWLTCWALRAPCTRSLGTLCRCQYLYIKFTPTLSIEQIQQQKNHDFNHFEHFWVLILFFQALGVPMVTVPSGS